MAAWYSASRLKPAPERCGKDFAVFIKAPGDDSARIIHDANIKVQ